MQELREDALLVIKCVGASRCVLAFVGKVPTLLRDALDAVRGVDVPSAERLGSPGQRETGSLLKPCAKGHHVCGLRG